MIRTRNKYFWRTRLYNPFVRTVKPTDSSLERTSLFYNIYNNNNIYNNKNINNEVRQDKDSSKPKNQWQKLEDKYGEKIVDLVCTVLESQKQYHSRMPQIEPDEPRVINSIIAVERLVRINRISFEDVQTILLNIKKSKFWRERTPTLANLRNVSKSNKLIRFENIEMTIRPLIKEEQTIEQLIKQHFENSSVRKAFMERCVTPAIDLFGFIENKKERELVRHLIKIFDWFATNQKRPPDVVPDGVDHTDTLFKKIRLWREYIPKPLGLVERFVKYIARTNERSRFEVKVGQFARESASFTNFMNHYQDEIGYDVLTGRMLR